MTLVVGAGARLSSFAAELAFRQRLASWVGRQRVHGPVPPRARPRARGFMKRFAKISRFNGWGTTIKEKPLAQVM